MNKNQSITVDNDQMGEIIQQLVMAGLTFSAVVGEYQTIITLTGGF